MKKVVTIIALLSLAVGAKEPAWYRNGDGGEFGDPMIAKAVGIIRQTNKTSISFLQRKLGVGYNRAANIVEELEARGLIGPDKGQGQRDIFLD